ncbi:hypothetical protein [Leptolyngbya phage Lbo-JY46]
MAVLFYFIIGIIYVIINATKRNLDGRDDPMQVLLWMFAWPVYMILRAFVNKNEGA